jgi:predicted lysophospholipase L1 biosynthesis ABC-type transport system permease subunit
VAQARKDAGSQADPTNLNGRWGFIVARSGLPPEQMESAIRKVVRELDPQLPLIDLRTMDEIVSLKKGFRRFNTAVISSFALAAVLLAGLGIYSIVAFSVASRAQEMAIRVALGSQPGRILGLVLISGAKLAAMGGTIGLAGTMAAASVVRSFLFQVSPFDPTVLALASIAVFALGFWPRRSRPVGRRRWIQWKHCGVSRCTSEGSKWVERTFQCPTSPVL